MTTSTVKPMTESQFGYAIGLARQLHTDPAKRANALLTLAGCDFYLISSAIDSMKATLASQNQPAAKPVQVIGSYLPPLGSYLLNGETVKIHKSKVSGVIYLTVNGAYQGSVTAPKAAGWMAQLNTAEKAKAAMIAYGAKSGKCGKCHHKLTDPVSIAKKIGPVCEKKYF